MDRAVKELAEKLQQIDKRQDVKTANLFFQWVDAIKQILLDEEFWALETAMKEADTLKVFRMMQANENQPFEVLAKIRGFNDWDSYCTEMMRDKNNL